jgi:hypothetical protein
MCVLCVELPATLAAIAAVFPFLRARLTTMYRRRMHSKLRGVPPVTVDTQRSSHAK